MNYDIKYFTYRNIFVIYIFILNVYGLIIMGIDKRKALKGKYRIPEKSMFLTAFIGGAMGIYFGMRLFHHKTLHKKFKYGIPAIIFLNIFIATYLLHIITH